MTGPQLSVGPGRTPTRGVGLARSARPHTSERAVVEATAWAVAHAGAGPLDDVVHDDADGYGQDDGPAPEDVPDLGDGGEEDLPGSAGVRGLDVGSGLGEDAGRPDGPRPLRPPARPAIVFTPALPLDFDVPTWWDADGTVDGKLQAVRAQVKAVGSALTQLQAEAILAPDLAAAHAALLPMTKAELSGAVGLEEATGSFASRHRGLFVQIAAGVVPLEFFFWALDRTTEETILSVDQCLTEGLTTREAARRTAERLHALPNTVGKWAHRVAALRAATDVVLAGRREWPHDVSADVAARVFGRGEGEAAVRLALVGRLGPAPRRPAGRPGPVAR